ncbi:hypothetical protein [Streptomyces sp. NPDC020607]|uniref:hypothetical protein n=1 Tax=Streptomyces sp. NPDC020607 TaxID=3365082 RepID=UPI0037AE0ADB
MPQQRPSKNNNQPVAAPRNIAFEVTRFQMNEPAPARNTVTMSREITLPGPISRTKQGDPIIQCAIQGFRMLYLDANGNKHDFPACEKVLRTRVHDVHGSKAEVQVMVLLKPWDPNNVHKFKMEVDVLTTASVDGEGGSDENDSGSGGSGGGSDW